MRVHPTPHESGMLELILDGVLPGPFRMAVPPEDGHWSTTPPSTGTARAGGTGNTEGTGNTARAEGTGDTENADTVEIVDSEGTPIARLTVATTTPDGRLEGPVTPLREREDGLFRHLRRTPEQIAREIDARRAAAVVLDAPLTEDNLRRLSAAASEFDCVILLPTLAAARLLSPAGLVRATQIAAAHLPVASRVVPVPLADMGIARSVAAAYGVPLDIHLPAPAEPEPELFPDEIAEIMWAETPPMDERGFVVFFTGLSGSGKSTIARRLRDHVMERTSRSITSLDGDVVRRLLSSGLGYTREDRETNIRRIGFVAAEVARAGGIAICAPIAPYASTRDEVAAMVADAGAEFVLVHVATPLEECERRDRKGLYARARAGELPEFTGITDPYEDPADPDVRLDTTGISIEDATTRVLSHLIDRGLLPG